MMRSLIKSGECYKEYRPTNALLLIMIDCRENAFPSFEPTTNRNIALNSICHNFPTINSATKSPALGWIEIPICDLMSAMKVGLFYSQDSGILPRKYDAADLLR